MRLLLKKGALKFSLIGLNEGYAFVEASTFRGIHLLYPVIQQKRRIGKW
jgi:hypothetical protein